MKMEQYITTRKIEKRSMNHKRDLFSKVKESKLCKHKTRVIMIDETEREKTLNGELNRENYDETKV